MSALRRAKRETALGVALADLSGRFDGVATTRALTRFRRCRRARRVALRFAAGARLKLRLREDVERGCGFVVLALGKHGGRELNYSSDIDLALFYDPDSPAIPAGVAPGPLFVRLAQAAGAADRSAHGGRLRAAGRLAAAPRSRRDADRHVAAERGVLLRERSARTGSARR